jgi:hypothetical protein
MMDLDRKIAAFESLGEVLAISNAKGMQSAVLPAIPTSSGFRSAAHRPTSNLQPATCNLQPASISNKNLIPDIYITKLNDAIASAIIQNPWFIEEYVRFAIRAIVQMLTRDSILNWLRPYKDKLAHQRNPVNVGVVMPGNIPLAGFHDFLCVLMSGNRFIGKLSSDDNILLPAIAEILVDIEPSFKETIVFCDHRLTGFDAVIATGSNNTARYFDYYFGKYPGIIRHHRNSVAVIDGEENMNDLEALADDIFIYFGLGCRNVSKVFLPFHVNPDILYTGMDKYRFVADHYKYRNNYDYCKSIFMINGVKHSDNGFLLLTENSSLSSPLAVVYYEYYDDPVRLNELLRQNANKLQCIISKNNSIRQRIPFGTAQQPALADYADGIDTMNFLIGVK